MTTDMGRPLPFGPLDDATLEVALTDLASAIALPPTPDLATPVARRLRAEGTARGERRASTWRLRWALIAALLALLLFAGAAVGFGWRLPGLIITSTAPTPAPTQTAETSAGPALSPSAP